MFLKAFGKLNPNAFLFLIVFNYSNELDISICYYRGRKV